MLRNSSAGFGWLALGGLLGSRAAAQPMLAPRAKHVIFCFMDGGPSHVDTFDPKPMLKKHQGQPIGTRWVSKRSQASANRVWFGSPWAFQQRGRVAVGQRPVPEPRNGGRQVVRGPLDGGRVAAAWSAEPAAAHGRILGQAPSFGAWVSYGLGTENANLPAYMLLNNDWVPNGGLENFGSSFLPANHQATAMRPRGRRRQHLAARRTGPAAAEAGRPRRGGCGVRPCGVRSAGNRSGHRQLRDRLSHASGRSGTGRYLPEPEHVHKLYGVDSSDEHQRYYATQALRARRLVEAGVRFVEITCPSFDGNNSPWDQHSHLQQNHEKNARVTEQSVGGADRGSGATRPVGRDDRPVAGEMGRTPHTPAIHATTGRDHHVSGFSIFLAGGGFRGGMAFGETDEFGADAIANPLTVHDIHATILRQLGIDHERLTFRHGGRDQRLTDVHGRVVGELLG